MGDRTGYDILVGLHVAAAVVGFGAVALTGVYGATAARVPIRARGTGTGLEEAERYFRSPGRAEWLILAVPFLGLAALGLRPQGADFAAFWVIGGFLVWLVAAALLLGVVRPAERSISAALPRPGGELEPDRAVDDEAARTAGRRLKWASVGSDVLFVLALALMVSQPR